MKTEANNEIKKMKRRQANQKYYATHKKSVNEYIVNYINYNINIDFNGKKYKNKLKKNG